MTSPGIVDFLLARIAEDEDAAKRAAFGYGAEWTSVSDDVDDWSVVHADGQRDMVGCEDRDVTGHIARHDPARVLADCASKRRIVEQSHVLNRHGAGRVVAPEMRWVLASLALPYADHPDYREEWKP